MARQQDHPQDIQTEAQQFRDTFKTILLSTSNTEGVPDASYAPHTLDEAGNAYIFISQLALHTNNLITSRQASVMFIADERDSRNLFARQRITLNCSAIPIPAEDASYQTTLDQLEEEHGNMVGMLRSLPDFTLFRLTPLRGRYVRGFGNAWDIEGPELTVQNLITGK